ncbi:hypothetical protein BDV06DRAFT_213241 [Aspergillus oleicola]
MFIPQSYKRAVFKSAGQALVIEEARLAAPGPREVLIMGRVAALGDRVAGWAVGDRIGGAWHGGHDGSCNACRKGWYQMCDAQVVNGETKGGGCIRHINVPVGATVASQGFGGLGHLAIQYANKMGFRVVAISRGKDKKELAKELGAHEYIDSSQERDVGLVLHELGVPGELPIDTVTMLKYGLAVQVWPSGHAADSEDAIVFSELHGID